MQIIFSTDKTEALTMCQVHAASLGSKLDWASEHPVYEEVIENDYVSL